jgi:hypothetical protein
LLTRDGQKAFSAAAAAQGWGGWMDVKGLRHELERLLVVLPSINGFPFDGKEVVPAVDTVYASDASEFGLGVISVRCGMAEMHTSHSANCESALITKRLFSAEEAELSSTHRELTALLVVYTDQGLLAKLRGKNVAHLTDNKGTAAIMAVGSPVSSLQQMAVSIFQSCRDFQVRLRVHWRRRSDPRMEAADARSRHFDNEDWGPDHRGHLELLKFGAQEPKIDLFATAENTKCVRFASKFGAEQAVAEAINAFSLDWGSFYFYACPPPRLIVPALRQVARQGGKGVMILPVWPTSQFWPFLLPDNSRLANMVVNYKRYRPHCLVGEDVRSDTFHGIPSFDLVMLELDGSRPNPFAPNLVFM